MRRGARSLVSALTPRNTVAPVVSGTVIPDETLSCTTGTWTGVPTPTFTYQWKRGGTNIASATSATYVMTGTDCGPDITCDVTATSGSRTTTASSNAIAYNAATHAALIDYFTWTVLSDGLVASWLSGKLGVAATQGTESLRPTKTASGVEFDGVDNFLRIAAGSEICTAIAGRTSITPVVLASDTKANNAAAYALLSGVGAAGSWGFALNDPTSVNGSVESWVRGGTSGGGAAGYAAPHTLATTTLVSICNDIAVATTGCAFIRVDGVSQTVVSNPGATAPGTGTLTDLAIDIGGITGLLWPSTVKCFALVATNTQGPDIRAVEGFLNYLGSAGLTIA